MQWAAFKCALEGGVWGAGRGRIHPPNWMIFLGNQSAQTPMCPQNSAIFSSPKIWQRPKTVWKFSENSCVLCRKGKCMNFSCVNITPKKGFNPMQKFSKSTLGSSLIAVGVKAKLQLCVLFPQAPSPRWPVWLSRTTIANVLHPPDPGQNCDLINSPPKMFPKRCLKK